MPYCDAALTDKAAQSALSTAKLDRKYGTFLPRTPGRYGFGPEHPM